MSAEQLVFLSIPGLRPRDISLQTTPTLFAWAKGGALTELVPTFPCVTSPVQASMWTGLGPERHGVIGNGFYYRDRHQVELWVGRNGVIDGEQIWNAIARRKRDFKSAAWHGQNIKDAAADFLVTPAPIHEPDGTMKLWCYSKPVGLYQELLDEFGHFPLQHYWGPLSNIESTKWILKAARWLHARHQPNFHWIYIPHLDYASQKFGPDSPQAQIALQELDRELGDFAAGLDEGVTTRATFVVAGEYAMADVSSVVYPNRLLREAGLLSVKVEQGAELVDFLTSTAVAVVDHQFAHVYVQPFESGNQRDRNVARVAELFDGTKGIAGVFARNDRQAIGMDHPRSGDAVLICDQAHWLAYYWWLDDAAAPPFARTVDIHRKPGYDPVELFFDPKTRSIPLDASLVKGSHGAPVTQSIQHAALICSKATPLIESGRLYRDTDIKAVCLGLLGIT